MHLALIAPRFRTQLAPATGNYSYPEKRRAHAVQILFPTFGTLRSDANVRRLKDHAPVFYTNDASLSVDSWPTVPVVESPAGIGVVKSVYEADFKGEIFCSISGPERHANNLKVSVTMDLDRTYDIFKKTTNNDTVWLAGNMLSGAEGCIDRDGTVLVLYSTLFAPKYPTIAEPFNVRRPADNSARNVAFRTRTWRWPARFRPVSGSTEPGSARRWS